MATNQGVVQKEMKFDVDLTNDQDIETGRMVTNFWVDGVQVDYETYCWAKECNDTLQNS